MTEEEKKAIKLIYIKKRGIPPNGAFIIENELVDTILNLIQKQDTEINKLNNVIDRMAEVLNDFDYDKQCESCRTDICSASVDGTGYTQCIKEYFMKDNEVE